MKITHCPNCNKNMGFKRSLGWGTFFAIVLTFGFWILLIPFYPARCITCGTSWPHQSIWTTPIKLHKEENKQPPLNKEIKEHFWY